MSDDMVSVRALLETTELASYVKGTSQTYWLGAEDADGLHEHGEQIHWSDLEQSESHALYKGDATVEILLIPSTSWGDYSGDDYQRSNHRSILRDYPEDVLQVGYSTHDGQCLALRLDREIPQDLADGILALLDYPLWDESDHSDLEMELEQECWESYGRDDWKREVGSLIRQMALPDHIAEDAETILDNATSEDVTRWFGDRREDDVDGCGWFRLEDATSGFWEGSGDLAVRQAEVIVRDAQDAWDAYAASLAPSQAEVLPLAV